MTDFYTDSDLTEKGYPVSDEMVKMVNTDLLPFFAENFPSPLKEAYAPVATLEGFEGYDFVFIREDGSRLGIWEEYFKDPEGWKAHRLWTRK